MIEKTLSEAERAIYLKRLQLVQTKKAPAQTIKAKPEGAPTVLSFAQERLWFLQQWMPETSAYNIPVSFRLRGSLDEKALYDSFSEIICRHKVLQGRYQTDEDKSLQCIYSEPIFALKKMDLTLTPIGDWQAEAQQIAMDEVLQPFDLEKDIPLRVTLLCSGVDDHILLLTMHHIASDGWSMGILMRELAALYNAFHSGQGSPLSTLDIQYEDFGYWQREFLQGDVLNNQLSYWKNQLSGAPVVLELPTDHPRPPVRTSRGAIYQVDLDPEVVSSIRELSKSLQSTPFMTFLAAFQVLLYRYSGQTDLVIGSPIAGRNYSELEGVIGCFINTLALRTTLSPNMRFRDLVTRVREVALEAYAHQDLPFEKLVDELKPERNLSHNPLVQVMFSFNNTPYEPPHLSELTIEPLDITIHTAKFDLSLSLEDNGQTMNAGISFSTDLFELETIRRMATHFQVLLSGIAANPDQRLFELPLLSSDEYRQICSNWNETQTTRPEFRPVHQLFEEQAALHPDATAVVFEENQFTYRELNQRAYVLAH